MNQDSGHLTVGRAVTQKAKPISTMRATRKKESRDPAARCGWRTNLQSKAVDKTEGRGAGVVCAQCHQG